MRVRCIQARLLANEACAPPSPPCPQMAYFNKQKFATDDAMRIGRLHTHLPGWTEANVAFMQVGFCWVVLKVTGLPGGCLHAACSCSGFGKLSRWCVPSSCRLPQGCPSAPSQPQSGGYAVSNRIGDVSLPTLVVWGRNDEILS